MKKIVGVLFLIFIMITGMCYAAYPEDLEELENLTDSGLIEDYEDTENDEYVYESNEEVDDDYKEEDVYKIEESVTINQTIDGNLYVIAKDLKLDGAQIYGNVYAIAENVEIINAQIESSLYVIGEKVSISGNIKDLYAIGEDVTIKEDAIIWRTARMGAEKLTMNGEIDRDVYATVSDLTIGESAIVSGTLNYWSESEGNISDSASIGDVKFSQEEKNIEIKKGFDIVHYIRKAIEVAFKTFIIALIIVLLTNKFSKLPRTEKHANDLIKEFGKGCGVLVVTPILSILLMISIIGTFFGIALLGIYVIALYIALSIFALDISYRIMAKKQDDKNYKMKLIGFSVLISVIVWIIGLVPVIGSLIKFLIILMGLGIIFDLIFKKIKNGEVNENETRSN